MRKGIVVFELTEGEVRAFRFSSSFMKSVHNSTEVRFDRIPISTGIIEQGAVRDENALINILSTYRSQISGSYKKAYLAISQQQGFIQHYSLPWLPNRDRKSAISLLVDEEISIPRLDLLYDFHIISEEKHKSLEVLLAATRRSILDHYALIFRAAGFEISGMDFTFSILGKALRFETTEDVLFLQGESDKYQIALYRGIVPVSVRILPLPADEWDNEIRRFLLYHRTQYTDLNVKRLIWSGSSQLRTLAERLAVSNHGLTIKRAMLVDTPDSWGKVVEDNPGCSEVTVGYALRIATHRPGLNLWFQPTYEQRMKQSYFRVSCFAMLVLIAGTIIGSSLSYRALPLQQEVTQLLHQGTKIEEQNRNQQALVTAWNQMSLRKDEIGNRLAKVQALAGNGLRIEQVVFKHGSLSLRGSADESKSVQNMIQNLRLLGWKDAALTSYKLTAFEKVEFTLSAKTIQTSLED